MKGRGPGAPGYWVSHSIDRDWVMVVDKRLKKLMAGLDCGVEMDNGRLMVRITHPILILSHTEVTKVWQPKPREVELYMSGMVVDPFIARAFMWYFQSVGLDLQAAKLQAPDEWDGDEIIAIEKEKKKGIVGKRARVQAKVEEDE